MTRRIAAPPAAVWPALVDAGAIAAWRVPDGMSSVVHAFDPRVGGAFRVSLTYDDPRRTGKSEAHTDTYHGHFAELVSGERSVEVIEFETDDPMMRGEMTITTTLLEADGGSEVVMRHDGLPPGVAPADNELGTRLALDKLAVLVEGGRGPGAQPG